MNRSYQWRRCDSAGANCLDIAAASAPTYALVAADVGHTIRVRETATNAYGQGFGRLGRDSRGQKPGTPRSTRPHRRFPGPPPRVRRWRLNPGAWTGRPRSTAATSGDAATRQEPTALTSRRRPQPPTCWAGRTSVTRCGCARRRRTRYGQSSVDSTATGVVKPNPGKIAGTVRNPRTELRIANASVNCGSGYTRQDLE